MRTPFDTALIARNPFLARQIRTRAAQAIRTIRLDHFVQDTRASTYAAAYYVHSHTGVRALLRDHATHRPPRGRTVILQENTTTTEVVEWDADGEPRIVMTLQRNRTGAIDGTWSAYRPDGSLIRHFARTQWLVNWLVKCRHVTITHRPIDTTIRDAIANAQET